MHKRIVIPLLVAAIVAGCESVKSTLAPVGVALKPVTDLVSNGSAAELYVSVSSVAINEKPSGSSAVVTNVGYASAVRVLNYASVLPARVEGGSAASNSVPRWVRVAYCGTEGYIPERALVSKNQLRSQDVSSMEEMIAIASIASERNFSDIEDPFAPAAVMGAFGKVEASPKADLDRMTNIVAEIKSPSLAELEAFRADGLLVTRLNVVVEDIPFEEKTNAWSYVKGTTVNTLSTAVDLGSQFLNNENKVVSSAKSLYSTIGPLQEFQLGQAVGSRMIVGKTILSPNDPRTLYVNKVGGLLALASNSPSAFDGCKFLVMEDDRANACCLSGGLMLVTTGMLRLVRDEDELAAVFAHEMAHQELRHGAQNLKQTSFLTLMGLAKAFEKHKKSPKHGKDVAMELLYAYVNEIYDDILSQTLNGYGKEAEAEADLRASEICALAGYEPTAVLDIVERFKAEFGTYGGEAYSQARGEELADRLKDYEFVSVENEGRLRRAERFAVAVNGTVHKGV